MMKTFLKFFRIFFNSALIVTLELLLIPCVERFNFFDYECLSIFERTYLSFYFIDQIANFIFFQVFEQKTKVGDINLWRKSYFEPFYDK